jgi:hypothetical protein
MTCVLVAGDAHNLTVALQRELWIDLLLFFPLVAMADALPPGLRVYVLRYLVSGAMSLLAFLALALRLPMAADTPGCVQRGVMGFDCRPTA